MVKYSETTSPLGSRIMNYRKARKLTQADLAERYNVSGPAIFKFEKGFVTPSLKLWQKIAANIGIPEKEAVLIWVREKLPPQMKNLISEAQMLDVGEVEKDLKAAAAEPQGRKKMREFLLDNAELSPALKKFVGNNEMWDTLKPTCEELMFLVELTRKVTLFSVNQFRDAMMVVRNIQNPDK